MNFSSEIFSPQSLKMAKTISPERKKENLPFIRSNFGKISQREIARRLSIGKTTVNRWSRELGLKHKKHTVDEEFFDNWTEESVYILGFIYADGNVSWNPKRGYQSLTITAAAKDKTHLEIMRNLIKSTKPLLYSEKTNSYRLIANSKRLVTNLMSLGVYPNKSKTVTFPNFIPDEMMAHFLRGVIDGDGSVYYLNRERSPYFSIKIYSGSIEFLNKLAEVIKNLFGISGGVRQANPTTFGVEYTCSRGKELANIIYSNSTIFLDRKYQVYRNILEDKNE